jgi:hypothetical protein
MMGNQHDAQLRSRGANTMREQSEQGLAEGRLLEELLCGLSLEADPRQREGVPEPGAPERNASALVGDLVGVADRKRLEAQGPALQHEAGLR